MSQTPLSVCGFSGFDTTPGGGGRAGVKVGAAAGITELAMIKEWPVAD